MTVRELLADAKNIPANQPSALVYTGACVEQLHNMASDYREDAQILRNKKRKLPSDTS